MKNKKMIFGILGASLMIGALASKPEGTPMEVNSASEVTPVKYDIAKPGYKNGVIVVNSTLNCRSEPNGTIIDSLNNGTRVGLLGVTKDSNGKIWVRIIREKTNPCWVSNDNLKPIE